MSVVSCNGLSSPRREVFSRKVAFQRNRDYEFTEPFAYILHSLFKMQIRFLCGHLQYALSSYLMIEIITMHIAHIEIFCTLLIVYWILTITTQD